MALHTSRLLPIPMLSLNLNGDIIVDGGLRLLRKCACASTVCTCVGRIDLGDEHHHPTRDL